MSLFIHTLRLADDALVFGHRLSEWCGHAPTHEEDLALANIALDLIGQARALYALAAELDGKGRREDDFAYQRDGGEFHNLLLLELPNGDFAFTVTRIMLFSAFMLPYWRAAKNSADARLSAIAAKAEKEVAYHLRHAAEWVIRLGDGTQESGARMMAALESLWPWTGDLFEMDESEKQLAKKKIAPDRSALKTGFKETVGNILRQAHLQMPKVDFMQGGGRKGQHTEHLGSMLAEMQVLARRHPEAVW